MKNLLPFDLKKALAGRPVLTECGFSARILRVDDIYDRYYCFSGVVACPILNGTRDEEWRWRKDGSALGVKKGSGFCLFLLGESDD